VTKVDQLNALRDRFRAQYNRFDPEKVQIGDFTYGTPLVLSWGERARLTVGKFCSIGANVQIYLGGNHHTDWLTTYPFNVLMPEFFGDIDGGVAATKGDVTIGNDVWIGNNVMIMSGVTIGDGAVICAGAVVTKNVQEYAMVGGVPAEFIRYRAAAHNLKHWRGISWWDWDDRKLAVALPLLMGSDYEALVDFHKRWEADSFV